MHTLAINWTCSRSSSDPVELRIVGQLPPGAVSSWVHQRIEGWTILVGVCCLDDKALGALDSSSTFRQGGHVPTIGGRTLGPPGKHLPGTDGIELFDPGEEKDADHLRRRAHRGQSSISSEPDRLRAARMG